MVGQWTVTKPSRSDEVLDADQQLQIANQIRAQFDSMAPKRPTKPSRSESDSDTTPPKPSAFYNNVEENNNIPPELGKLRSLQSQSPVVLSDEGTKIVQEDFVETQYYKELDSIDKQHHKTGSGFIRVVGKENGYGYGVQLPISHCGAAPVMVSGYKSNPATNDWTPSLNDDQVFVSCKPNRSESC